MALAEPTVCAKSLRAPFFMAAVRTGKPVPELATAAGVSATAATDIAARVPHSTVVHTWEHFATLTSEPSFGVAAAEFLGAAPLDLVDHAILRAPTLREVVARFMRYQTLFHDANASRGEEAGGVFSLRQGFAGALPRSRHLIEFILAMWTMRTGAIVGPSFRPLAVRFRHAAPADLTHHHAVFGKVLHFDAEHDALDFSAALLDVPLASSQAGAPVSAEVLLGKDALGKDESFTERVHRKLVEAIRAGDVDIDAIARSLAASRRTLQRRLGEDGTSFRAVLDNARREVALDQMTRGTATVTDLTFLLGFSDLSAFARAFKRWTGTTPSLYLREKVARSV